MTQPAPQTTHAFDHIGPAPYKFAGFTDAYDAKIKRIESGTDSLMFDDGNTCIGSCDHCGTGISNAYWFKDANGKRFKVGESCADKAFQDYETYDEAKAKFENERRRVQRVKRHKREAIKLEKAQAFFEAPETIAALSALPHPKKWAAEKGQTAQDWAAWYWENAGTAGRLKAHRQAVKMLAK